MQLALRTYALADIDDDTVESILKRFGSADGLDLEQFKSFVANGELTQEQQARYFVAISLSEAESIRRVMHLRLEKSLIDGTDAGVALRCLPAHNIIFDASDAFSQASEYNLGSATACMKFINSEMYFTKPQLNQLLSAIENASPLERRRFFERIIGCRRRTKRRWRETPLSFVFHVPNAHYALCQRALAARMRASLAKLELKLYDACLFFDADKNGFISAAELMGGIHWLGLTFVTPEEVAQLIRAYDLDMDGHLSYPEFMVMVQDENDVEAEVEEHETMQPRALLRQTSVGGSTYEHCVPMCEQELDALQSTWTAAQLKAEEAFLMDQVCARAEVWGGRDKHMVPKFALTSVSMQAEEELGIFLESEQEADDRAIKRGVLPNPLVGEARLRVAL